MIYAALTTWIAVGYPFFNKKNLLFLILGYNLVKFVGYLFSSIVFYQLFAPSPPPPKKGRIFWCYHLKEVLKIIYIYF